MRPSTRLFFPPLAAAVVVGQFIAAVTIDWNPASAAAVPAARPAATTACPSPGGGTVPTASTSGSGIVVQGHGWGHGLGMSQYGAQGAAKLGCTHAQILAAYYAGTRLARMAMAAPVELTLAAAARRSTVSTESSAVRWTGAGRSLTQPARTTWSVTTAGGVTALYASNGRLLLRLGSGAGLQAWHTGTALRLRAFASTARDASASIDRRLRQGTLGFVGAVSTMTVSEVITGNAHGSAVDRYLWGLGEVPVRWPAEALRAQVDAARTYLSHTYDSRKRRYVIGVTTAAQVYRGADQEDVDVRYAAPWRLAVTATHDEVIVDRSGTPIWAMYSSSDGGRAESRAYVYGAQAGFGYLVGLDDSRWDLASDNPRRSWAKVFAPGDLARRLGFSSVSALSLAAPGTTRRGDGLVVTGVRSGRTVTARFTGDQVRGKLGLPSPVITVSWGSGGASTPSAGSGATTSAPPASGSSNRVTGVYTSTACTATACAQASARFSGAGSMVEIKEVVEDKRCNGRLAYARLLIRYSDGTSQLTRVRYAAARCSPPGTSYPGLTWQATRPVAGFAVVVGEAGGGSVVGNYQDNPNT